MATGERLPPPPPPPQLPEHRLYRIDDENVALQIVVPSSNSNDTYIIKMPKDQIYRIPPPENTAVVERFRQPHQKTRRQCSPCACYTASALFAFILIAIVVFLIYKFTLSPRNPLFVIKSFSVNQNPKPTFVYHVGIEATNPNGVNALVYVAGTAELVVNGTEVAKGQSPAVTQAANQIDEFHLALTGHGPMIRKRGQRMKLKISLHLKKKTWLMAHTDLVFLQCQFVVDYVKSRKDEAIVISQTCAYL